MPGPIKISHLTELTTPADDDALVTVDAATGVPTTKKITRANLLAGVYKAAGTDVAVADGGTGASTAATALANLGAAAASDLTAHTGNVANPHTVTKTQVGLASVPNTDATLRANHTGTQTASTISDFQTTVSANTTVAASVTHAARIDNPHGVTKAQVGLSNVDNTSDASKPVSTAQAAADALKANDAAVVHLAGAETVTGAKTFNSGTFLDKGSEVYNVKAYGAVGDGTTDDLAAINLAITAAAAGGGGKVFFPKAAYAVSSTIFIKAHGVWLTGSAFATTFADQVNQQAGINGISRIVPTSGFPTNTPLVQFGELGTNKMWTGGGIENLLLIGTHGVVTSGNGVNILNVQSVRVQNCGINKTATGVYVSSDQSGGISNVLIEHNIIFTIDGPAIDFDSGSDENFARFNYISGPTKYGIRCYGFGNTMESNYIESIRLAGTGYRDGAAIFNGGGRSFIYHNEVLSGPRDGIYNEGSVVTILGNTITNVNANSLSNGSGIYNDGAVTAVLIADNNIKDYDGHMVYGIYDGSSVPGGVSIGINHIVGAVTAPIFTAGNLAAILFPSKVGIGNQSPAQSLDVTGNAALSGFVQAPTIQGSAASGATLTLKSTTHATKGKILFGNSAYDEVNNRLGISTTSPASPYSLDVAGIVRASRLDITDNNSFVLSDQTSYRKIQTYSGAPLCLNPEGNNVAIGGITAANSVLQIAGAVATAVATKSAAYTLAAADSVILADATTTAFTVTLPTAAGITGRQYTIKRSNGGSNNVTVGTTSGQTVDGTTTKTLGAQFSAVTLVSDGSNWLIVNQMGTVT